MADGAMPFNWDTGETRYPEVRFWPFAKAPGEWQALYRGPDIPVAIACVEKPADVAMEHWIPVFLSMVAHNMGAIKGLPGRFFLEPHEVTVDTLVVLIVCRFTEASHA